MKALTVTIPDDDLFERLQGAARTWGSDVELIQWDMQAPLPSELAAQVDVVVIGHYWNGKFDWGLLKDLPNLKMVQLPSAGYEHALPHLPPGVVLCNGRGVHSAETAELAVGLILAMQRGIAAARDNQHLGQWVFTHYQSLADRRVLVVGAGSVGTAVVSRLKPFEVTITLVSRNEDLLPDGTIVHPVSQLPNLALDAEIMVIAVPLNEETYHLIDDKILSALPDDALVVNVSRGDVIDQQALLQHLVAGRLRAALDVTSPEPLPADNPLWTAPNVLITPHQGGNTDAGYPRFATLVESQINNILTSEVLENVVRD
ncbi:MAG: 2-hydroxyacid dehydrogenase [Cellulomonadaceae bacterium]|jgi:phosphoglycerate dehydrogenase-like enzyme|nr:2-hydroxyacid dehydrogenase [Cellulomonadaceae bacterium]